MKEFKHLPGLDLIRVFGILVVVFYHYQVETAVRGLCPADFLPATPTRILIPARPTGIFTSKPPPTAMLPCSIR